MSQPQPGILAPVPPAGHALTLRLTDAEQAPAVLQTLRERTVDASLVIGLGWPLVQALRAEVAGLRSFPVLERPGGNVPSTQGDLWAFARGGDAGEALHALRCLVQGWSPGIERVEDVPCFSFGGRDLSGYEDGTENPRDEAAVSAAIVADGPLAGSSFVATQRWVHDLAVLDRLDAAERDAVIGRAKAGNAELAEAPASAHVKRAAQESFDPAAFMLRRSMPCGNLAEHGLYFVAYGADLDRFERVMRRMTGADDGVADALFRFSRPVTGAYWWCPPVQDGKLDLGALSLAAAYST
jgi:putative iron-dependent peroxidase